MNVGASGYKELAQKIAGRFLSAANFWTVIPSDTQQTQMIQDWIYDLLPMDTAPKDQFNEIADEILADVQYEIALYHAGISMGYISDPVTDFLGMLYQAQYAYNGFPVLEAARVPERAQDVYLGAF